MGADAGLCICQHPVAAHEFMSWAVPPREDCQICKKLEKKSPCERYTPISTASSHHYRRGMNAVPKQVIFLPNGCRVLFNLDRLLLVPAQARTHALLGEVIGGYSNGEFWVVETDLGNLIPLPRSTKVLTVSKENWRMFR